MSRPDGAEVDALYGELEALVSIGPRFHGTPAAEAAARFIAGRLGDTGLAVTDHEFSCDGWALDGQPSAEVLTPSRRALDCEAMLWSAGTPPGGVAGQLVLVGNQGVWGGSYVWRKFGVVDGDRLVAFLTAREEGPAIPQPRPSGSAEHVPHVVLGAGDGAWLHELLRQGAEVRVHVEVPARAGGRAAGRNLVAEVPGTGASGREVLVCAHYDTFWNTPGAYDNGSGVVALLALARRLVARPLPDRTRFVFFTGEEWHLAGSRAFVRDVGERAPEELDALRFVLNLDGIGRGDLLEGSIGPERFEWDVNRAVRAYARRQGRDLRVETRFPPLMGTDHAPFYEAGIPSAHLTFNDWPLLHHRDDVPNRQSAANIAFMVGLAGHLLTELEPEPARARPFELL